MPPPPGIRAILTDIEGTTTPIAFVYETLFPFAAARLEDACGRADSDPRIGEALRLLRAEYDQEEPAGRSAEFGSGAAWARRLMAEDRKSTGLKALQGILWEEGYRSGELKAEVYDDVPAAFERWREAGLRLRVFSSGSVLAQKLLFAHTRQGDLMRFFEGYHDTSTGPKGEARSYRVIAQAFGVAAGEVLYLSDVVAELDAAAEAGLQTALLLRPGNPPQPASRHAAYGDFRPLA